MLTKKRKLFLSYQPINPEGVFVGRAAQTADGRSFELGGKRLKDVTGYNLLSMLVGSEGTLCVVTKIHLRLLPRPASSECLLALFPDVASAISAIPAVIREGGIMPTSVEFMDGDCLRASCRMLKETIPYESYGAMLLFEIDGQNSDVVHSALLQVQRVLAGRAGKVLVAGSEKDNERFWKIRKQVAWALKAMGKDQTLEDISMPIASVPPMMKRLEALAEEYDILIPCFGHATDGNLHANPMRPESMSRDHWREILPEVLRTMYRDARELGGTISGEHGIGHKRRSYMNEVLDDVSLDMMQRVKKALDRPAAWLPALLFVQLLNQGRQLCLEIGVGLANAADDARDS